MNKKLDYKEIEYLNSEKNLKDNENEIIELKEILYKILSIIPRKTNFNIESLIKIAKYDPIPESIGLFPFEHKWYLYTREDRESDVIIYGPYTSREAGLLAIQTLYVENNYGIEYKNVSNAQSFKK